MDNSLIFISYRRSDSFEADHIFFQLASKFHDKSIFIDKSEIKPGDLFPSRITKALKNSIVVLVVIAPEWISVQDPKTFQRRIDLADDWVRLEVEYALQNNKIVIPVLIKGRLSG